MRLLITTLCLAGLTAAAIAGTTTIAPQPAVPANPPAAATTAATATPEQMTKAECSACHMVYPAGLMPKRSWDAVTSNLKDHFGEDASLDPDTTAAIKGWLMSRAADAKTPGRGFARGVPDAEAPLRITELPLFKRIHGRFTTRGIQKVGSMAKCNACHAGAEKGIFEDD